MRSLFKVFFSLFIGKRYAQSKPQAVGQRSAGRSAGPDESVLAQSFIRFINRFSVAGIALGVMSLVVVLSVMNGLQGQLKGRILGVIPQITVSQPMTDEQRAQLQELPNVAKVMAQRSAVLMVQSAQQINAAQLYAVAPNDLQQIPILNETLVMGTLDHVVNGRYQLVISSKMAQQMGVSVGDPLRLFSTSHAQFTPFGQIPSQRLFQVGAIVNAGSELEASIMYGLIDDLGGLQRQAKMEGVDTRITLQEPFNIAPVAEFLHQQGLSFTTWRDSHGMLFDAVQTEKTMMTVLLALVIVVAAFNIIVMLIMSVAQKRGDIAVLMVMGATSWHIRKIFLFTGVLNGIKGLVIGMTLGLLLVWGLNDLLILSGSTMRFAADGRPLPIDVQPLQLSLLVVFALLLSILSALIPAINASRQRPIDGLHSL